MKFTIDLRRTGFAGDALRAFLTDLQTMCSKRGTDFIVIGAFARDLLLMQLFYEAAGPQTRDVDVAIYLENWDKYDAIIEDLLSNYGMRRGRSAHEYYSAGGIKSDLLPYGKIEVDRKIVFPAHPEKALNMLGFNELRSFGITAVVDDELSFTIPPPEGIILIKSFAWNDRAVDDYSLKHVYDIGLLLDGLYLAFIGKIAALPQYADVGDLVGANFHAAKYSAVVMGRRLRAMLPPDGAALIGIRKVLGRMLTPSRVGEVTERLAKAINADSGTAEETLRLLLNELS